MNLVGPVFWTGDQYNCNRTVVRAFIAATNVLAVSKVVVDRETCHIQARSFVGSFGTAAPFDASDGFEGFVIKILRAAGNPFTTAQAIIFVNGHHDEAHAVVLASADRADLRLVGVAAELLFAIHPRARFPCMQQRCIMK